MPKITNTDWAVLGVTGVTDITVTEPVLDVDAGVYIREIRVTVSD